MRTKVVRANEEGDEVDVDLNSEKDSDEEDDNEEENDNEEDDILCLIYIVK